MGENRVVPIKSIVHGVPSHLKMNLRLPSILVDREELNKCECWLQEARATLAALWSAN